MTATRTKRILSVQPVGDGGGSERALIRMVHELTADGWECHVAVPGQARLADEYAAAGATLHVLRMERLTTSGGWGRWLRYAALWPVSVVRLTLLTLRSDVEVVHSNSLHSWYGFAAALLARRPHVWHAREIVFQSPAALRIERWMAKRFADSVIAVSRAVASQLDPANVVVITDEPDTNQFRPGNAGVFREAAGIGDSVPLLGSVARIDTWKGFEVLLDAFPRVRAARGDAEMVIAGASVPGKEDYAADLRRRAESMEGVRWLGHRSDVAEVMADLDVFVQVSTEPEPFGLVVVEALASGVPVVAGAEGGPREILAGDNASISPDAGVLVTPGDPDELAAAALSLLPVDSSSAAYRQARVPLRTPSANQFGALFDEVADRGRRRRRGRRR